MRLVLRLIGRLLRGIVFALGVLALIGLVVAAAGAWSLWRLPGTPRVPAVAVLELDLRESLPEARLAPALGALGLDDQLTVTEVVATIDAAAADPRIKGLIAKVDGDGQGFAVAQELRDAVARFRAAGKPTHAFAFTFGELGPGNEGYYLATAFDRISLQPVGLLGLTGLEAQLPYAKDLLDRLGIGVEVGRRSEYKSASQPFTATEPSAADREQTKALLGDLASQIEAGIATGRGLQPSEVAAAVAGGPWTGTEAVERRLVDKLQHFDEAVDEALREAGDGARPVLLERYADAVPEDGDGAVRVALIRAIGVIQEGEGNPARLVGSDAMRDAFGDAIRDREVRAILLRIDSPGGSAVASETVGRMVRKARDAGKPVVVSMGNVAASGGYWIAMDATRIVAEPGTITGSIGVVAGKPVLGEALAKVGINVAEVRTAPSAAFWSLTEPYTPQARARLEAILDDLYGQFVAGVARGRNLDLAVAADVARGRVWSGRAAHERGLVDRLGGLDIALVEIREQLQLAAEAPVALEPFPRPRGPIGQLVELMRDQVPGFGSLTGLLRLMGPTALPPLSVR